ncbi:PRAME family member 8-like [Apodemus sylvaticus]|uniref:PRAME family member 8-like n=1 Tax=Apodemus sylvaticus TaxID=10129 RepID=UPI00224449DE|nr:PRAME family member 8-like [Apodemus sylvaticus]
MTLQAFPTLQELAIRELASNEDFVISTLEYLPKVFFPPLFKEAFIKRRRKIVKHMVATWPYSHLYLGPLMDNFHIDTFKAVLDGVDWLNDQEVWPRKCRLKELYFFDVNDDFLETCATTQGHLQVPWHRVRVSQHNEHTTLVIRQLRLRPILYCGSAGPIKDPPCICLQLKKTLASKRRFQSQDFVLSTDGCL